MSRKAKKPRFKEYQSFINCFDFNSHKLDFYDYLASPKLYNLELGCGTAKLSLELARRYPKESFLAIDIKSDRMWRGAKTALQEGIGNVAFIRSDINNLDQIFLPDTIRQIWLSFPDPYPAKSDSSKRLTHPKFISIYARIIKPAGKVFIKTDNRQLFEWSLDQFKTNKFFLLVDKSLDLHRDYDEDSDQAIQTVYESRFISSNLPIFYAEFELNQ